MSLSSTIERIFEDYDEEWDGFLYKVGGGVFYHTSLEGAEFYGSPQQYKCPNISNVLIFDTDSMNDTPGREDYGLTVGIGFLESILDDFDEDDWVDGMERAIPILLNKYKAIIILGETGREVTGVPVEVVFK